MKENTIQKKTNRVFQVLQIVILLHLNKRIQRKIKIDRKKNKMKSLQYLILILLERISKVVQNEKKRNNDIIIREYTIKIIVEFFCILLWK